MSGSRVPAKQRLACELENWGPSAATGSGNAFIDAYGDVLLDHIEKSLAAAIMGGQP